MPNSTVQHIRRIPEKDARQELLHLLRKHSIVNESFTGNLTLFFHQGGLRSSKLEQTDPF